MDVTGHNGVGAPEPVPVDGPISSIRDVARFAQVSHQTVSRVINDHPNVSAATRKKVEKAIADLGFRPSSAARDLANGAARAVTVLTSNTSLFGYAQTLGGIEEAARSTGVRVSILVLESDTVEHIDAAIRQVSDPRTGAVIVLAFDAAGAKALRRLPATVRCSAAAESILARSASADERVRWAWFNDLEAARQATSHLLDLGHHTVHYLAIPSSTSIGDRERGWELALQAAGAVVPDPVRPLGWDAAAAHPAAMKLLQDPSVTAVLCGNDDLALGVIRAAHDLGRRIPADISVVGFDDVPGAEFYTPSLTTVRFDFAALGRQAFEMLQAGTSSSDHPEIPLPKPVLIVRESTGQPERQSRRAE
jgi:DNA-binding LacI/PurR family transcriptional regulator